MERRSSRGEIQLVVQEAKQAIEASDDSLNVYVVPLGSAVTMDYQTNRVRIYCGMDGKVQKQPKIG